MNDNDIIKALECCVQNDGCKECPINPHKGNYGYCTNLALTHALNLINRQKAEIEELRKENYELKDGYFQKRYEETEHQELMGLREAWRKTTDQNMDLQFEIERLETENKEQDQAIINALHRMGQIRAEAIKGFADRLKDAVDEPTKIDGEDIDFIIDIIDSLVKEMTEGQDES